jgi:hypothetical protein
MVTTTQQMLSTTPNRPHSDATEEALRELIEACSDCEVACVSCADSCLGESTIDPLRRCIRMDLDCADVCNATARVATRVFAGDTETCARACAACAAECERHAHHEHCAACAAACRRCAESCRNLLGSSPAIETASR